MFPIRKRKATYGTFTAAKKPRVEDNMPALRKYMAYRRQRRPKRFAAAKTSKHMNNGKFFTPSKTQPPIKKRPWEWIQVRNTLNADTAGQATPIIISEIATALNTQISATPASIKIGSIQLWNSAGVGTDENTPYIELRPNSLASGNIMGKEEDFGNLNEPASVGYKWSNTESQTVFTPTDTNTIANYFTGKGKACYSHTWVQYLL